MASGWKSEAKNQAHQAVASGLYIYVLQIRGVSGKTGIKTGKIVILR